MRSTVGFLLAELGDFQSAEDALRTALADADRMGLQEVNGVLLQNLGYVVAYCGRLDEARSLELRALEVLEKRGDARLEGLCHNYLATIALLDQPGMVEEGESLVRLVHAEALRAAGRQGDFVAATAAARAALQARAAKISDPEWRRRFLTAVPDNARTIALAEDAEREQGRGPERDQATA
jgi:hypothetical protein